MPTHSNTGPGDSVENVNSDNYQQVIAIGRQSVLGFDWIPYFMPTVLITCITSTASWRFIRALNSATTHHICKGIVCVNRTSEAYLPSRRNLFAWNYALAQQLTRLRERIIRIVFNLLIILRISISIYSDNESS